MSLCLDSNNVLANQVSTASTLQLSEKSSNDNATLLTTSTTPISSPVELNNTQQQQLLHKKTVTKLLVSNHQTSVVGNVAPVLQKISNPPVITVLNSAGGPLTVLKTICVTSGVSSAPHFSLVNNQSLTVTNAVGKTPTITLLNTPVTVVKMAPPQSQNVDNKTLENTNSPVGTQNLSTIIENRAHNVFVKNTCSDSSVSDVPQGHKFLTANSFSQTNVLTSIPTSSGKSVNNQKSKLKILGNVPSMLNTSNNQQTASQIMSKPNSQSQQQQRMVPRQKVLGPNTSQPKYINKLQNPPQQKSMCTLKQNTEKAQQQAKVMYPTHKSQIKTLPPVTSYMPKPGMKTLNAPQSKTIPGQIQRTGSGLRTIPPQRPPKLPNKLNYIGKHAVQAQKVKHGQSRFNKPVKQGGPPFYNNCVPPPQHANKQLAFNQALTAEILETLGNKSGPTTSYSNKSYEILPNRFATPVYAEEQQPEPVKYEDTSKSGLDALSLICQAVLLDHNYNATLPPDSPTRIAPISGNTLQANGMSGNSMLIYSPGSSTKSKYPPEKKRTPSCSNPVSTSSSMSNISSSLPSNSASLINLQDDDAASDISDCSDRKHDTEGEETDTAPEAEAVNNDELYDHYGDYVTRCICGFLHDDGYMVECDQCKVWQHVQCVVKNKQVPDEYLCEKCNPSKPVDPHKARLIQQQWLRERQLPEMKAFKKDVKMKENTKLKEILTDSDSSDAENPRNNNTVIPKGRTPLAHRKKSEKQLTKQKKELKESNMQRKSFKKRERKLIRRKSKVQTKKEEDENRDTLMMPQLPQLRQWIENYEEAVTNHYSPELRARISNIRVNGSQNVDASVQFDSSVNKCRVHTLPLTDLKYLVATEDISPDSSIIELRGKYMLSIQHRNSGGSLNTRQHAQRPGPFLFFYRLNKDNTEVCVDTRTYGNVARFVRRSCKPNAELRHCIEKGVLHLYIVAISHIENCGEITIKHESHDLAAIGTTQISCYCGNPSECKVNKSTVKRNGDNVTELYRKKRGRRTASISTPPEPETPLVPVKEEAPVSEPLPSVVPQNMPRSPSPIKVKTEPIEKEEKKEIKIEEDIKPKEEIPEIPETKEETIPVKKERPSTPVEEDQPVVNETSESEEKDEKKIKEEKENECKKSPVSTRRSSQQKEKERDEEKPVSTKQEKGKNKKLSREERKLEAILRAIEQMEKANQRKQEHKQTKHVPRRESEPSPYSKDEEKAVDMKQKRKRRKGRARTTSTHSTRRDRLNSGDSYFTSGDENMLSPNDGIHPKKADETTDDSTSGKHDGFLLTFSNHDDSNKRDKSPVRENDSNSNSAHSSPETPLSLACSLVQAAVEPLESGFKFPKTKKGLMNEWLNKTPDAVQTTSSPLSVHINNTEVEANSTSSTPSKNVSIESGPKGSAKKRWLRQAISEDKCDSPQESPPISDMVAPPKKRRLPRESISNDNTPPSTPTSLGPPENRTENDGVPSSHEIRCFQSMYEDLQKETLESELVLKERAAEMKQEFTKTALQAATSEINQRPDTLSFGCLMDPRLRNHNFTNSEHLVGTVEKTLSILGFEERKPEVILPARRKLSITEYRQRKKLNNNEINDKLEENANTDECVNEENNSSESSQMATTRPRLNSPSSSSSSSSDDETSVITELPAKVPAFNSEPTELERQREMQSLRLKKAFGLSIDVEAKKSAITGDSLFKSDLSAPPLIKSFSAHDSPSYLNPTSCEVTDMNKATLNSPRLHAILTQTDFSILPPSIVEQEKEPSVDKILPQTASPLVEDEENSEDVVVPLNSGKEILDENETSKPEEYMDLEETPEEEKMEDEEIKPHMFYTPDEEEGIEEKEFPEIESINYVPPFNNPIYPSMNYTSVIDEEGRYEGRNPSPPPSHLESEDVET